MIHMELGPSTVVGLGLAMVGLWLYILRTRQPKVSRDYDLLFSSIGLLCGGILIFQGWRLDPILLLCQMLSSVTAIFFIGESLWLRALNARNQDQFQYEKQQNRLVSLKNQLPLNKNEMPPLYQDLVLSVNAMGLRSWENINYTKPIGYN